MEFVNLTPHTLNIFDEEGNEVLVLPPSGQEARITVTRKPWQTWNGIPIYKTVPDSVEGLPEYHPNKILIVSGMFRVHLDRPDLVQPGELRRDDDGRPIGCIGLTR